VQVLSYGQGIILTGIDLFTYYLLFGSVNILIHRVRNWLCFCNLVLVGMDAGADWEVQGEGHCILWVGNLHLRVVHANCSAFPHCL